jgi:hypothetical protein
MKDNRLKRWLREHRAKKNSSRAGARKPNNVRVVYRCKSPEEAQRRTDRAKSLVGKPFLLCPGLSRLDGAVAFIASDGTPVRVTDVEMVYNDMLLMDAISDHGKDGPLYVDALESEVEREVLKFALEAYAGARWD